VVEHFTKCPLVQPAVDRLPEPLRQKAA
jgi:hypothetical protein